ncbi:MAG: carbonic anhydrase [Coriobacteriales bacterium]|jgi:carbonic anhydrase
MDAVEALERLKKGNEAYLESHINDGDVSPELIQLLFEEGQSPFACVIACADSRVVPEHIFMTGLGELFVIRVAGNVIGDMELASCVYAAEHLHTPLVVLMEHTHCGAIESAMHVAAGEEHEPDHALAPLLNRIVDTIGGECDQQAASIMNIEQGLATMMSDPVIRRLVDDEGLVIRGALYHTNSSRVDFL